MIVCVCVCGGGGGGLFGPNFTWRHLWTVPYHMFRYLLSHGQENLSFQLFCLETIITPLFLFSCIFGFIFCPKYASSGKSVHF